MKITKREFIATLEKCGHVFIGVTRQPVAVTDLIETSRKILAAIDAGNTIQVRHIAENHPSYLLFSDGSRLQFNGSEKMEFFKENNVLETRITPPGESDPYKYIYYLEV